MSIDRFGVQILIRQEIWFEISVLTPPPRLTNIQTTWPNTLTNKHTTWPNQTDSQINKQDGQTDLPT